MLSVRHAVAKPTGTAVLLVAGVAAGITLGEIIPRPEWHAPYLLDSILIALALLVGWSNAYSP